VDAKEHVTYTNLAVDSKNCKRLQVEPAPAAPARPVSARPGAAATPAAFPRVNSDTQRERDEQRRAILSQELASEQQGLAEARQALAAQEKIRLGNEQSYQKVLDRLKPYQEEVARRQRNIDALNRELASLR
jgi:hypothetical protein